MDYQFSFNTRMLVLLCVALILLLGMSVALGVLFGRDWPDDSGAATQSQAQAKMPSGLKAAASAAASAK